MFFRTALVALAALTLSLVPASAQQGREFLGHGRLVSNDTFAKPREDKWQTGSVAASRVRGYGWNGALPTRPFDILEYRIGAQVVAPSNLRNPAPNDRRFGGALSFGVHTHFARGATEFALGGDLVLVGPQTKLLEFQSALHDAIGVKPASAAVRNNQIDNDVLLNVVAETGHSFQLGGVTTIRPFAEVRWGLENVVRAGADFTFGSVGQGELLVRDPVTGQRYRAIHQRIPGFSFVVGGDVAWVDDSVLLPNSPVLTREETRNRVRAGMHWQGESNAAFYGVTWLSKEFEDQLDGQLVGSLRFQMRF